MGLVIGSSLPDTFFRRLEATPQKAALLRKKGGLWSNMTWVEVGERVFEIAFALQEGGIKAGDKVAILSQTRVEWFLADLAILSLGAVTVPVYAAVTADDVYYILQDSGATAAFLEDGVQAVKVESIADRLPKLRLKISFERVSQENTSIMHLDDWLPQSLKKLSSRSDAQREWRALAKILDEDTLATLVYTSGTVGVPRGVEISHGNLLAIVADLAHEMRIDEHDTSLLFLPVAHIMGRVEQWMSVAVGMVNAYAESVSALIDNLLDIRPTLLVSVPRIYEKLYASILNKFRAEHALGLAIEKRSFAWALEVGRRYVQCKHRQHEKPGLILRVEYELADRIFFAKIREKLGGRLRFAIVGGAPMAPEITEFFHICQVPLLEGYGLTETTGPATLNRPDDFKLGSVGRALPNCEIKLAQDSEIMVRGKAVFEGYHALPDETAQVCRDGWFYTGDLGVLDAEGFLQVTERKKDIIVTTGGKNIAPQKIENMIKSDPLFSQSMVVGDGRNFLVALITLNSAELSRRAAELNLGADEVESLFTNPGFEKLIAERIAQINDRLATYESIKRYKILARDFSIEAGELTPSLKIRRKFCSEKYAQMIEELYRD